MLKPSWTQKLLPILENLFLPQMLSPLVRRIHRRTNKGNVPEKIGDVAGKFHLNKIPIPTRDNGNSKEILKTKSCQNLLVKNACPYFHTKGTWMPI